MSTHEMPSIRNEMRKLEGETPWERLSSIREQLRDLIDRIGPDASTPDDEADRIKLEEEIAAIEADLEERKAA